MAYHLLLAYPISVIVSAFGPPSFLGACIESCMTQSEPDFELMVAAPGGEAASIVDRYSEMDRRITLLRGATLDAAAARAGGEFLAFLEGSDVAMPDRLERQAAYLRQNPNTLLVTGACVTIRADGKPFLGLRSTPHVLSTSMVRREAFRGADRLAELTPSHVLVEAVIQRRIWPGMTGIAAKTPQEFIRGIHDYAAAGYHDSAARLAAEALPLCEGKPEISKHLAGLIAAANALGTRP